MLVKVSSDLYINTEDIMCIIAYKSRASKQLYQDAKENNTLVNATKNIATKSIIILKNNMIISSSYLPDTLYSRLFGDITNIKKETH